MKSLLLALAMLGAPPTLKLPDEVKGEAGTFVAIRAESDSPWVSFRADAGLAVFPSDLLSSRKTTVVTAVKDGRYRVFAYTGNVDGGVDATVWVVIGTPPVVVTPPGPGPVNPPLPSPGIPLTGMRVLILEETSPSSAIPKAQYQALHSTAVLAYLDSKTMDPSGKRRWRRFDPNVTLANLPEWQSLRAAATPVQDQPWVVVAGAASVGGVEQIVFSGPYPATQEEALAFFKKWGG